MKKIFILSLVLASIFLHANATNLRGRILHSSPGGPLPAAGVRVDLFIWDRGQWVPWSYAITGDDGFYYFANIQPGATFCVQVAGRFYPDNTPPVTKDTGPHEYQDIACIVT
jgi:hypothetical protein